MLNTVIETANRFSASRRTSLTFPSETCWACGVSFCVRFSSENVTILALLALSEIREDLSEKDRPPAGRDDEGARLPGAVGRPPAHDDGDLRPRRNVAQPEVQLRDLHAGVPAAAVDLGREPLAVGQGNGGLGTDLG